MDQKKAFRHFQLQAWKTIEDWHLAKDKVSKNSMSISSLLAEIECKAIKIAMSHSEGNGAEAARFLGLNRTTLVMKRQTYGID